MSVPPQNSDELVDRFRDGEDEVLGELFAQNRERLKQIVRFRMDHRIAGRVSESDVIQDCYLRASQRGDHYREKSDMPFFIWLRLLVNQQLADLYRQHVQAEKRDVRKEVGLPAPQPSAQTSLAIAAQLAGREPSPSRAFSREEQIAQLETALNRMDELDREIIALRHFEELTNNEASAVLGIGVDAASKRYVRAIKRMKEVLADIPGFTQS